MTRDRDAASAKTPKGAECVARQPGPEGDRPTSTAPSTDTVSRVDVTALRDLIERASDDDLHDSGRYFKETCYNFTECPHGDCGDYSGGRDDGRLVAFLWNNRQAIERALAALSPVASGSSTDNRRLEPEEVEALDNALHRSVDIRTTLERPSTDDRQAERVGLVGEPCTLAECPPGLFLFNGSFGLKTEYNSVRAKLPYNPQAVEYEMSRWPDVYCLESGEQFWGGTTTDEARCALVVQPVSADALSARDSELEALRQSVLTFAAPWAAQYGQDRGWSEGELHPDHYELLKQCGARMDDFRPRVDTNGEAI